MMKVIGLTGGIATGKSSVSEILSQLGAHIIDADKVGHQMYLPDTEAWKDIVSTFGEDILLEDRTVNRPKLGQIVFNDKEALTTLNRIVHPRMYASFQKEIQMKRTENKDTGVVVLDAAILIEANWTPLVDQVWVVSADEETIMDRLCSKKGFTEEHARSRISSQLSDEDRKKHADVVIENNGAISDLAEKVREEWKRMNEQ